jgi:glycerol-3-phosphate dehydrogenase (NAD(P)+)
MEKILIIGAGEIGKALGRILKKKNLVEFWDKDKTKISHSKNLEELVLWANIIFLCVPALSLNAVLKNISLKNKVLICLSKGVDPKTKELPSEILEKYTPNYGLLYGPMIAEELNKNLSGFAILATKKESVFNLAKKIFSKTQIKIQKSNDVCSVGFCGVLKNIYALGLGIIEAQKLGLNLKGKYVVEAIKEMREITNKFCRKNDLVFDICGYIYGLGDLITTGFSPNSANYVLGKKLAKKQKIIKKSEGIIALPIIFQKIKSKKIKAPLLENIYKIALKNLKPSKILESID